MSAVEQPELSPAFSVGEAIAIINQTLDYAFGTMTVEGEVSGFRVNQGKYVFFDLKDGEGSLNCFMSVYQLRTQLEDGMRVRVMAQPKITAWGKFSLTVREVRPVGEGSLRRAAELLQAKLSAEGLFDDARKRLLPRMPTRVGVISSTDAAGYADFVRILTDRWSACELVVAHVQVQGADAPAQIIRALMHLNGLSEPVDAIAIVRGGGSADDLAAFNDEPLVRAIAASRIPTVVGVGHETDTSLADLVADVRAATPSNAAQLLVPDKTEVLDRLDRSRQTMVAVLVRQLANQLDRANDLRVRLFKAVDDTHERTAERHRQLAIVLRQLDPRSALRRGYALVFAGEKVIGGQDVKVDDRLRVETERYILEVGVHNVNEKHS